MRLFIVEDSIIMRNILQSMLSDVSDVTLIGHAVDELGAINNIDVLLPDVVILDLNLEQGSGIGVLQHIKNKYHAAIKVMVLTNHTDDFYFNHCMKAGADYFFDKSFDFKLVRSALGNLAYINRIGKKFDA